jgi:hypothetical protein
MKHLLLILTLLSISSCFEKNHKVNISIKVLDEKGNGLPESIIELSGKDTVLVNKTDFEGKLILQDLKIGTYKLNISYIGHYPIKDSIILITQEKELYFKMNSSIGLDSANIKWNGGWVTFEDEKGQLRSVKSKTPLFNKEKWKINSEYRYKISKTENFPDFKNKSRKYIKEILGKPNKENGDKLIYCLDIISTSYYDEILNKEVCNCKSSYLTINFKIDKRWKTTFTWVEH